MIYPVKIYNKDGELTNVITTETLQTERDNADKKLTYRERFNLMVNTKKQKTSKVTKRKRNATSKAQRTRDPVRSGRSSPVDDKECQEIDAKTESIINTLRIILK